MRDVHVVWFKRDLRVHDHRPLAHAAAQGVVLPLYMVEPSAWQQADASPRQWRFIVQSLASLHQQLRRLGADGLLIRKGEAVDILQALHQQVGIAALWSHEETGNDWSFARDRAVAEWCRQNNVTWHELRQDGVVRRLRSRNAWAKHWATFMAEDQTPAPQSIRSITLPSDAAYAPDFAWPDHCPGAQQGGREHGLQLLDSFLRVRGQSYSGGMSSPLSAQHVCSRLSPHLAWGTLSMREVVQQLKQRQEEKPPGWGRSLSAFEARLAWQSHFMQKLESEPAMEFHNLHPALAEQRQHVDHVLLDAWALGQTGLPLVDACMRMLRHTGWINFRMRAMLAAFACYHLWQPWRQAGLHLARLFIDYEPGIHWSQMQMQSGSTGINAFRIYNPVKQSHDQDPQGIFIRRWVPELARVPNEWIHEPWRMPLNVQQTYACRIERDYPAPVVEHEQAARLARERLHAAYRGAESRTQSQAVFDKHGSRKPRATRKPRSTNDQRQQSLFE